MFTDLFSAIDGNFSIWVWFPPLFLSVVFICNSLFVSSSFSVLFLTICNLWQSKEIYFSRKTLLTILIILILLNNFLGLIPLVFSTTTRLWVNRRLALLLWSIVLISGWRKSPSYSAAHLAPRGAPGALIPFLILIETIRILIRPITLTVRLVANISAGHIILALLANVLRASLPLLSITLTLTVIIFYYVFEIFVSFIQAYIFTLLIRLYITEHP